MDRSVWQVQHSEVACRLSQSVPRYGEAVFETVGGGRQSFVVRAKENPMQSGPTQLVAAAPTWNPSRSAVALGTYEIDAGNEPLRLRDEEAARVLDSLRDGLVPGFKRPLQADTKVQASFRLSPIDFLPAYRQYSACVQKLLPITFEQIQTTVIEFGSDQTELSAGAQKKIDLMLRYIHAANAHASFEVHAISSDKQRILENLNLSKQRAQQVNEYLQSRGVEAKTIDTSYQGARAGKGEQRFVTIRVKRVASD